MNHVGTNGYLTKEKFLQLSTCEVELPGFGKVRFRKIGGAEYEALWPMPPLEADDWPKISGNPETEEGRTELARSRRARREAEAAWLRSLPQEQQAIWRSTANDVAFRVIAACSKTPTLTVDEARGLGDAADIYYAAILMKSGLVKEPPAPAPPEVPATAEAPAGAA